MILFIDDERRYTEPYTDTLEMEGYKIAVCSSVDDGIAYLEAHRDQIQLVILDIMMPPGRALAGEDTQKGLITGLMLYQKLRASHPALPFIVLTNVSNPELSERFAKELNCRLLRKYEYLPYEMASEVRDMIGAPATTR